MTDEELLADYEREMELNLVEPWRSAMLRAIGLCRKDEPRIANVFHLLDYMAICDDDDTMDSFYGPDYFSVKARDE